MCKLRPKNDHVVIELAKPREKTQYGVFVVEHNPPAPNSGKVVVPDSKNQVSVGDTAYFPAYSGLEIKEGDKIYLVVPFKDIVACVS